ncbi:polysaccharide pyruvyl transferase family protein [Enterobacter sichuanensis]|uniref:polysaccharide pyruvyl transferase family protein n=1 Tax=Enterobacter sichuanensis TaxID=2071710 RepID=UPI001AAF9AC1|nr:polysaccharide pyruvyl transferase family protein [Enterobacter sichuanensis]MBO2915299.1 polysaccharide pyruvyl transferase family protein [Enterobacter sichuanensis]MBO2933390.1 polysaccharide pyruvyl transferase family protein [Enterobacter sichuanensis]
MFLILKKMIGFVRYYVKLKTNRNIIPLCYFDGVPNVGDELNIELITKITGRQPMKPPSIKYFQHLCAVGSVLSSMNKKSIVWGSGLISEDAINEVSELGDIRAVRGFLTKEKIENRFGIKLQVPLGDPALLMPYYIKPSSVQKKYKFGLVLHYVDSNHPIKILAKKMGANIIDVSLSIQDFVDEISKCEKVLSSSMHGLILSDTYCIPNQRIVLGDNIIGGDFKFLDYYSTTSQPDNRPIVLSKDVSQEELLLALSTASLKKTILNLDELLEAFPLDKFNRVI